jgi:antitoxin ParD1/3/4
MSRVKKISVALTPELDQTVRRAIKTGEYGSASEVIRDALRAWKTERALREEQIAEIRRAWQEGLDLAEEDSATIFAELRARYKKASRAG